MVDIQTVRARCQDVTEVLDERQLITVPKPSVFHRPGVQPDIALQEG